MGNTTERVDRLEEALMKLAYAQFNTEMEIRELKGEMLAFKNEMADFKNEMAEFKNEMADFKNEMLAFKDEMAEFKNEMLAFKDEMADFKNEMLAFKDEMVEFKDEMRVFKDEMAQFKDEVRRDQRAMNKRWGEISNKMGTIVEDIIYPSVRRIAREHFGAPEDMEFEGQRIKRMRLVGDQREFDGVFAWPGHVLLLEAKATVRPEYLEAFDRFVQEGAFFAYFPEYAGRRLIPVFSALALSEDEIAWLTQHRLYAVAMGEDAMELLNGEAVEAA